MDRIDETMLLGETSAVCLTYHEITLLYMGIASRCDRKVSMVRHALVLKTCGRKCHPTSCLHSWPEKTHEVSRARVCNAPSGRGPAGRDAGIFGPQSCHSPHFLFRDSALR